LSQRDLEFTVGIFVLIGILALGYLSIQLGGLDLFNSSTYKIGARFSTVTGLRSGASIEMAGVKVGWVDKISLVGEEALVTMQIKESVELSRDSIASIRTKGILGDKYIRLSQGGSEKIIKPGGLIRETEPPIDIEKILGEFIYGKVK
jgi:phospholipid/cholesterol/gamma-HCH transport system substrate-binding protein